MPPPDRVIPPMPCVRARFVVGVFALLTAFSTAARGQTSYEEEPIRYSASAPGDAVAGLWGRIARGESVLTFGTKHGYLESLLRELNIPASSQSLLFSKTSFQRNRISPRHPRALYFNDEVYVGYVDGGDVLEVAAADPKLGVNFYTLDQRRADTPALVRRTDDCLQCHAGSMTRDVPGLMLRSVFPDKRGMPILSAGTSLVTHETPFKDLWGGWYVTGRHGGQRHRGNATAGEEDDANASLNREAGANLTRLDGRFDPSHYLGGLSDLAALMVLDHQVELHNRITRANFGVRLAVRDGRAMNAALGRSADAVSDSTRSRIKSWCEPVVTYLLFAGEATLAEPVSGSGSFAADYAARGPRDAKGRSLRDLDLHRRLLKYPCSPLVYSESFDGLPAEAKEYIYRRLWDVLTGKDAGKDFVHLSPADRRAVLEILRDTKSGLPDYWKAAQSG